MEPVVSKTIPEEVITPVAIEFTETIKPTIPFIPVPIITPTPKIDQTLKLDIITPQEVREKSRISQKTTQGFRQKQGGRQRQHEREGEEPTPVIPSPVEIVIPKPEEDLLIPVITDTSTPPKEETIPKKELIPEEIIPPLGGIPSLTLPILFPERPKGGLGKVKIKDTEIFGFETKYEPSLLGILLGKKRKRKKIDLFTGFEIRGI